MRCPICKFKYKYPMAVMGGYANGKGFIACGICALEKIKKIHGLSNYKFTGELANESYNICLEERK